jgi:hypothetical protein
MTLEAGMDAQQEGGDADREVAGEADDPNCPDLLPEHQAVQVQGGEL